jgi:hypothetical protein
MTCLSPKRYRLRLLLIAMLVVVACLRSAHGAGPRLIMVHGGLLTKPVIIDDWKDNIDLIHASAGDAGISSKQLAGRSFLELELFSGPYWVRYVEGGNTLDGLRPESADQTARFYPSTEGAPAIIAYESGLPRRVGPKGLAILQRHGIPVSLESDSSSIALCILVANCLLILFSGWLIKKRSSVN